MAPRDDMNDLDNLNLKFNNANLSINLSQAETLEYHKKHIRALWHHIERLEQIIQIIPEGVKIKTGMTEILVLKNGGIILDGQRILLKTPRKQLGLPV
jgi:hypothetical protein